MNKTKIEWCDYTWNPITGCLHKCEYCYARSIATVRFGGASETAHTPCGNECQWVTEGTGIVHDLIEPIYDVDRGKNAPYPFEFDPTLHRYRLDEPQSVKKPQNVFVCSMADMFGNWVPEEWIQAVFDACTAAPQHRYLFLTKNPDRYIELYKKNILPDNTQNWFGTTVTKYNQHFWYSKTHNPFISIEPILEEFGNYGTLLDTKWVIVGAETGNRKGKVIPQREWIENIVIRCRDNNIPIFLKNSLAQIWIEPLIQEYPWGRDAGERKASMTARPHIVGAKLRMETVK